VRTTNDRDNGGVSILLIVLALLFGVGFGAADSGRSVGETRDIPLHATPAAKDPCLGARTRSGFKTPLPRGCAPRLLPGRSP
jgi:hypothetical protein